ncbi:MAG: PKD domain-containing protein, partial [Candidatus Thermoplasmatota archaeon]|nr:PKD domain-containing protein [Candidatus Thermoplasmatota archaeon]
MPEFEYSSERRPLGVWCHEFGHELGLPDFYDTDGSSEGIGHWGVMASGSWADNGETPVHFSAFSKAEMEWLEPVIVTGDLLDVRLKPASRGGLIIQLPIPGNWSGAREYFMLENRQQLDYDTYLPGEGLLIWHVDEDVSNNRDESHKRLDLEEADGYDDLDNVWNSGDSGDPYSAGDEFTDAGYPNSTAYNLTDSGWRLSDIRKDGDDILLDIRFLSKPHAISDAAEAAVDLGEELQFWGHDSWDEDGNLVNYTWNFDDGKFAWIEDPLHTFEDYGTFDVTLTVRDDDGLEAVATLTIYVNAPPVPVIDAQTLELLAGESVSFDGSSSWDPDGTIQFWLWNFDDGATSGDQLVEHVYVQPRSYNVSLKVYDNLNSIATTWVIITVINLEPQVDYAVTPVSANTTVSFTLEYNSSDPDGSIVGWTWDFGDGNNSSEQNPQYRYLLPGDYSVTLTAQDNLGAQNSTTQVLAVTNALPLLDFAVPQGVRNGSYWVVPADLEISIAGSGSSDPEGLPLEFAWDVDGVNYFTSDIAVILGTGSHVVSLAITDTHGATVNGNWTLMTVVQPLLSLSPHTVNALTGEMTSFNATVLQGSVTTWEWDGNLTVEGGDVFSFGFVPEAPGSYELRVR